MKKNIEFIKKEGKLLEIDICAIPEWDGFDKILSFLQNEYKAEVFKRDEWT